MYELLSPVTILSVRAEKSPLDSGIQAVGPGYGSVLETVATLDQVRPLQTTWYFKVLVCENALTQTGEVAA